MFAVSLRRLAVSKTWYRHAGAHRQLCDAAADSSSSSSSSTSRLHSTDIAFKPAESGWGGSKSYSDKWDKIFGEKKEKEEVPKMEWSGELERLRAEIEALSNSERTLLLKSIDFS